MNNIYSIGFYFIEIFLFTGYLTYKEKANRCKLLILFLVVMFITVIQKNLVKRDIFDFYVNLKISLDLTQYHLAIIYLPAACIFISVFYFLKVFTQTETQKLRLLLYSIYFDLAFVCAFYTVDSKRFKVHTAKIIYFSFIVFHCWFYYLQIKNKVKLNPNKQSLLYFFKFIPFCALQWHEYKAFFFIVSFTIQFFAMYKAAFFAKINHSLGFYFLIGSFHILYWHLSGRGFTLNDLDMNSAFIMLQNYYFLAGSIQVFLTTIIPFVFFYFLQKNIERIFRHQIRKLTAESKEHSPTLSNFEINQFLEDEYEDFL
jgi:hypothetical protein